MFPNLPQGFTLAKLIGGISKSLTIANQVIPIYQQLNPMVQNARKAFGALKEMNLGINNNINKKVGPNNINNEKRTINNSSGSNNPSFFQ